MRLDKYFSNLKICSRKECSKLAKKWYIKVNWEIIKKADFNLKIWDIISFDNQEIKVLDDITILLHKPAWYISSDIDENNYPSYKKLLEDCPYKNLVKIAWRLDVDTEWLLVLSSNWSKIHQLISPKKWKEKIYYVELEKKIKDDEIKKLEEWIEFEEYTTLAARVCKLDKNIKDFWNFKESTLKQIPTLTKWEDAILLAIKEWKFHQIKNMAKKIWNKVVYLKRLKLAEYELEDLKKWEWKII